MIIFTFSQTVPKGHLRLPFLFPIHYNVSVAKKLTYSRYIWFVDRARKGKHPNTTKLMEKFEISLAQAQRDIEYMRDTLGAPLKYVAVEKGYELEDHAFSLPSVWIEDDELLLLALVKELVHDPDSQKILTKLLKKVAVNSSGLEAVRHAVSYKGMGHYRQEPGILNPLLDAILKKQPVEIRHREVFGPPREPTWRQLEPLHLLFYRANWYLLAVYGKQWRTFALSRIEEVRGLPGTIQVVSQKKIRQTIDSAFGIFVTDQEHPLVPVRLRFIPDLARFARTVLFFPGQKFCDGPGGCLDVSFPSTLNRELIGEILAFGEQLEVLEPKQLRKEIAAIAKKTADIYNAKK